MIKVGEGDVFIFVGVEIVFWFVKGNFDFWLDIKNLLFDGV